MTIAAQGADRVDALFAAIDENDAAGFVSFLTEDATFRFGSAPAVVGRAEIAAGVSAFLASIAGCKHDVHKTIAAGETLVCEGDVMYTRHDKSQLTVPFVDVFEMTGDLINNYKIYIDISALYAT